MTTDAEDFFTASTAVKTSNIKSRSTLTLQPLKRLLCLCKGPTGVPTRLLCQLLQHAQRQHKGVHHVESRNDCRLYFLGHQQNRSDDWSHLGDYPRRSELVLHAERWVRYEIHHQRKVVLDNGTTKEYETAITTPTGNGTYDETVDNSGDFVTPISGQDNDDKDFIDTSKLVDEFFADMNTKAVNANSQNPYEYVTKIDGATTNGTVAQGHVWMQGFIAHTSVTAKSDFLREGGVFATPANITLASGVTSVTVVVSDGRGNTEFRRFGKETDIIQNLPTIAPNNFRIKVVGAGDSFADDYYLVFNAENDETDCVG